MTAAATGFSQYLPPREAVCGNCNAQKGKPCTQPTDTGRVAVAWFHFVRESVLA